MELFDATNANEWKTTGMISMTQAKKSDGAITMSGRNIGAEQREPEWTPEQLSVIKQMSSTVLQAMPVTDTRRAIADPDQEFVMIDENNTVVPTEKAYVSTLTPDQYCVGIGPPKYDITGSPRFYADAVIADMKGSWLVNQWTSEMVVIEGVANNVLMQTNRTGNISGRRIGYHFARIGLPKFAFGPLFNTLNQNFPGTSAHISQSEGYLWMNASWGVASFPGTFSYMTENGIQKTSSLIEAMRVINGRSSLCLGTIAISITTPAKMVDGTPTMETSGFGLSVKLHNAFNIDIVDFHGPPQQGSTGMMISKRLTEKAKIVPRSGTGNVVNSQSIFANANKGLFGQMSAAPPTVKSTDTSSFM